MSEEYYHVEMIVDKRVTKKAGVEYYVKWTDYDHSSNTWEPEANLSDYLIEDYLKRKTNDERVKKNYEKNKDKFLKARASAMKKLMEKRRATTEIAESDVEPSQSSSSSTPSGSKCRKTQPSVDSES